MAETENTGTSAKSEVAEVEERRNFTLLVGLACFLSVGSLAYSTYSFLDLNKIDALRIDKLGGLSLIGLSAALTMDIIWSATMVAEYRGRKVMYRGRSKKGKQPEPKNILPLIGWAEVLAVAVMLGYHGNQIGGWTAAFTAILPIATKFTWILALDDIRDPNALTEEQKAQIAEDRRNARLAKEKSDATADLHKAELEAQRRENEAKLEDVRAEIERQKLEEQAKYELEEAKLRGENNLKALKQRLQVELQMDGLKARQEIDLFRMEARYEMGLRAPFGTMLVGEVVQGAAHPALTTEAGSGGGMLADLMALGLTEPQAKKADLARRYYAADYRYNGVKKIEFCEKNDIKHPSRLSEATGEFPREWFIENNLATWLVGSSEGIQD
ncbi:hypothetical protein ACFW2V_12710 [Streptomyces sp. NPDC058947]|uniref:hypothetical protein n=1 Tax=Streptomyces sp. NPDC058947 TaxID=3346675 RepID=UPI0036BC3ABB